MTDCDVLAIKLALRATGWFFIAICQYHLFRFVYSNLTIFTPELEKENESFRLFLSIIIAISESIMEISLCHSINRAMASFEEKQREPESRLIVSTDSLFQRI